MLILLLVGLVVRIRGRLAITRSFVLEGDNARSYGNRLLIWTIPLALALNYLVGPLLFSMLPSAVATSPVARALLNAACVAAVAIGFALPLATSRPELALPPDVRLRRTRRATLAAILTVHFVTLYLSWFYSSPPPLDDSYTAMSSPVALPDSGSRFLHFLAPALQFPLRQAQFVIYKTLPNLWGRTFYRCLWPEISWRDPARTRLYAILFAASNGLLAYGAVGLTVILYNRAHRRASRNSPSGPPERPGTPS